MMRFALGCATLLAAGATATPGSGAAVAPCRIQPVADFGAAPSQWLGGCASGQAEGLGVLRSGTAEPYKFFAGEAKGGHPVRGLLITADGWFAAASFDAGGTRRDITSGDPNAYHALYVLAARAATATAQRFAAAGNRGSAGYYQRLAKKITEGEPE
jgi:hypothetical protein